MLAALLALVPVVQASPAQMHYVGVLQADVKMLRSNHPQTLQPSLLSPLVGKWSNLKERASGCPWESINRAAKKAGYIWTTSNLQTRME